MSVKLTIKTGKKIGLGIKGKEGIAVGAKVPMRDGKPALVTVNGDEFGSVASGGEIDVPVVYENGTPTGQIIDGEVVVENPVVPSGVGLHFVTPEQWDSYNDFDLGFRVQGGWFNDMINPPYPKVWADLDYTNQHYHFLLKENIRVRNNANKQRFVDVDGLQEFPNVNNKQLVAFDKHTGLAFHRDPHSFGAFANRDAALSYARNMSINVDGVLLDDWWMVGFKELFAILGDMLVPRGGGVKHSDPVTGKMIFLGPGSNQNFQAAFTNTVFGGTGLLGFRSLSSPSYQSVASNTYSFFIHKAQNLILEP